MEINHTYHRNKNTTPWVNKCEYIVLHDTWKIWDWNIRILWGVSSEVSCHYLIRTNWKVFQFVDDSKIAWHCWKSKREWKVNLNQYSIWIEIESDWVTFTDVQKQKTRELVLFLAKTHVVPCNKIIRHKDIAPTRKQDPRDNLWSLEYSKFSDYQNSFHSFDKKINPVIKVLINYLIKYLWKSWNSTQLQYEKPVIKKLADQLRFFKSYYK